jgi:hypothetical protein
LNIKRLDTYERKSDAIELLTSTRSNKRRKTEKN